MRRKKPQHKARPREPRQPASHRNSQPEQNQLGKGAPACEKSASGQRLPQRCGKFCGRFPRNLRSVSSFRYLRTLPMNCCTSNHNEMSNIGEAFSKRDNDAIFLKTYGNRMVLHNLGTLVGVLFGANKGCHELQRWQGRPVPRPELHGPRPS